MIEVYFLLYGGKHMNELKIFKNEEFGKVRTVQIDGEPWFVGGDVARALGYIRPSKAVMDHIENEDTHDVPIRDAIGREQLTRIINESGLYALIMGSKLPSAKKFKRWVTSEVLPEIRKTGSYAQERKLPGNYIEALEQLVETEKQKERLELENKEMQPKALFADAVSTAKTTILVGELAKLLKQNGIEIGQNRLYDTLRNEGYLISRKGNDYNLPTQKSMQLGLFEIKERTILNPDGSVRVTKTTKVTGKGQQYFINRYLKK